MSTLALNGIQRKRGIVFTRSSDLESQEHKSVASRGIATIYTACIAATAVYSLTVVGELVGIALYKPTLMFRARLADLAVTSRNQRRAPWTREPG